jgi:cell division protein FtsL
MKRMGKHRVFKLALGIMLFAGLYMQISMLAEISGKTKEISRVERDIKELSAGADNLALQLAQLTKLSRIEERALELGMQWPEDGQLRVISIPTEYGEASAHKAEITGSR